MAQERRELHESPEEELEELTALIPGPPRWQRRLPRPLGGLLPAVMPALAGTARMRYLTFLGYNAAGGLAWGATVVLLDYAAGASYATVEKTFGRDAAFVVLALVIVWRVRKHHAEQRADAPIGS